MDFLRLELMSVRARECFFPLCDSDFDPWIQISIL